MVLNASAGFRVGEPFLGHVPAEFVVRVGVQGQVVVKESMQPAAAMSACSEWTVELLGLRQLGEVRDSVSLISVLPWWQMIVGSGMAMNPSALGGV